MHKHATTMIDRALAKGIKIADANVSASTTLREIALDFVATYRGTNNFVQDIAVKLADYGNLSIAQMRGALNVMIAEARAARVAAATEARLAERFPVANTTPFSLPAAVVSGVSPNGGIFLDLRSAGEKDYDSAFGDGAANDRANDTPPVVVSSADVTAIIPDGYYTVKINDAGEYRTLRVETADRDRFDRVAVGTQIVSFLSGPDNESSYTGFAFLTGKDWAMWRRFQNARELSFAMALLINNYADAAGEYVKQSARCFVCNKRLTTLKSIDAGIGPICRRNVAERDPNFDFGKLATAAKHATTDKTIKLTPAEKAAAYRDADDLFA